MESAIQAADGPYANAAVALKQIQTTATERHHTARVVAAILLPPMDGLPGKRAQIRAMTEVYRAGAVVLAQMARDGHPPNHLVFPEMDHYTGKPLGYRREGAQGFVIYSAGADGRFDGGKPGEYSWKPYRVAFRYPGAVSR